jgi:hypothetical protein
VNRTLQCCIEEAGPRRRSLATACYQAERPQLPPQGAAGLDLVAEAVGAALDHHRQRNHLSVVDADRELVVCCVADAKNDSNALSSRIAADECLGEVLDRVACMEAVGGEAQKR